MYEIALHAVQFGNHWIKKIPRTAQIKFGCQKNENECNYLQIGQACSPLTDLSYSWLAYLDLFIISVLQKLRILYTQTVCS